MGPGLSPRVFREGDLSIITYNTPLTESAQQRCKELIDQNDKVA